MRLMNVKKLRALRAILDPPRSKGKPVDSLCRHKMGGRKMGNGNRKVKPKTIVIVRFSVWCPVRKQQRFLGRKAIPRQPPFATQCTAKG